MDTRANPEDDPWKVPAQVPGATQEDDLSDSSEDEGYETPASPPPHDQQPMEYVEFVTGMDQIEAMIAFDNALKAGRMRFAVDIALFHAEDIVSSHRAYADLVGFGLSANAQHSHITPIHELILHDTLSDDEPWDWVSEPGRQRTWCIMNSFETADAIMRPQSSGYPECRIKPGFPTVDPLFFAAHKNRNIAVLEWYLDNCTGRSGPKLNFRPLLWWLVRHADPVHEDVLRTLIRPYDINFGLGHDHRGGSPYGSHLDFTLMDHALIRQPQHVVDTLRSYGALTSLEVHAPQRIKKVYHALETGGAGGRPTFHRRSSFSLAEEALSAEEGHRCRNEEEEKNTKAERVIFWKDMDYGPLAQPRKRYSRTMTKMEVGCLFWWEEENKHLGKVPTRRELERVQITIPETLSGWSLLQPPSS